MASKRQNGKDQYKVPRNQHRKNLRYLAPKPNELKPLLSSKPSLNIVLEDSQTNKAANGELLYY